MFDPCDEYAISMVRDSSAGCGDEGWRWPKDCACPGCEDIGRALRHLDLTPLARHMGKPAMIDVRASSAQALADWGRNMDAKMRSTVWDYFTDNGVIPKPTEPTPADRALDKALDAEREFIARRKAKRSTSIDGHDWPYDSGLMFSQRLCRKCGLNGADIRSADVCDGTKAPKRCDALGDAMSKLTPHAMTIRERLAPYRIPPQ